MKFLILTALTMLLAVGSGSPAERSRRSLQHYGSPQLYNNQQYYTSQGVASPVYSEVSPQLYSADISPALYGSSYYPSHTYSSYASPSYALMPRVQYNVQASPAYSQVSAPAVYNAEHSEHASSSSHYRLQAPATVTYAQPSSAQYVQQPHYVAQPSSAQYVQQPHYVAQPSSAHYVQQAQYASQPSWQQGTWSASSVPNTWSGNNPWC